MKPVGIIILNWNGAALLRRYLPSVVAANSNDIADVVVVDNGSTDESLSVLKQEFPDVRTLCFDKNYGYAEGYNRAIRELGYRYSVLLNSDVAATPEWIRPLYEYMEAHPEVAACQPKILSDADHTKFEYAGASGGIHRQAWISFLPRTNIRHRGDRQRTIQRHHRHFLGYWCRADGAHGGISCRWRSRQGFLRPHGGNRPVLASTPARTGDTGHSAERGVPSWRRQPAGVKPEENLPQLPQQSVSALQESAAARRPTDALD